MATSQTVGCFLWLNCRSHITGFFVAWINYSVNKGYLNRVKYKDDITKGGKQPKNWENQSRQSI